MSRQSTEKTQRLIEGVLGEPLESYVTRLREEGVSWRVIAERLTQGTNGVVSVRHTTLYMWFGQSEKEQRR